MLLSDQTVYVDAAIFSWRSKKWCHLFSLDLDALHNFARRLGLNRAWFQGPAEADWPHYDITARKRVTAIFQGAVQADHIDTLEVAYRHQGWTPRMQSRISDLRATRAMRKFDEECGLHE